MAEHEKVVRRLTVEQKGQVMLAIQLLVHALAFDDADAVHTVLWGLEVTFPRETPGQREGR